MCMYKNVHYLLLQVACWCGCYVCVIFIGNNNFCVFLSVRERVCLHLCVFDVDMYLGCML